MQLTKKELEQYGSLKKEVESLESKLDKLYDKRLDVPIVAGKVTASSKDFPFTEYRVGVLMDDPKISEDLGRLIRSRANRLKKCRELIIEIEQFINEIEDSMIRQIFEKRYIEGLKVREVADDVGYTKGRISQLISKYMKD